MCNVYIRKSNNDVIFVRFDGVHSRYGKCNFGQDFFFKYIFFYSYYVYLCKYLMLLLLLSFCLSSCLLFHFIGLLTLKVSKWCFCEKLWKQLHPFWENIKLARHWTLFVMVFVCIRCVSAFDKSVICKWNTSKLQQSLHEKNNS